MTLGQQARASGIKLRQSYVHVGQKALIMSARYAHAGQFTRRNKQIRFLKVRVGRVIRDIERTIADNSALVVHFAENLAKAKIIMSQALTPKAQEKIYSWHAAEVECIGKGKARACYEFGCKATITTINGRAKGGVFVLHMDALHGKPHDMMGIRWGLCWLRRLL